MFRGTKVEMSNHNASRKTANNLGQELTPPPAPHAGDERHRIKRNFHRVYIPTNRQSYIRFHKEFSTIQSDENMTRDFCSHENKSHLRIKLIQGTKIRKTGNDWGTIFWKAF